MSENALSTRKCITKGIKYATTSVIGYSSKFTIISYAVPVLQYYRRVWASCHIQSFRQNFAISNNVAIYCYKHVANYKTICYNN